MAQPTRIEITGDGIRLGQFLKRADAVDQGSDVKQLLASEAVLVNGEVELRRGRQLKGGDRVEVAQTSYEVVMGAAPPAE
ncbi:MAG: RNA-binding S4 domain-containing protein [Actinomycetota bacterium]|nr:RNA-binding S4 domain-containing protein [Nocardioidaceae bacterium]MDQ3481503.1 RNA-binding S4 domain-containing protein [Actinomycetota bacterium]